MKYKSIFIASAIILFLLFITRNVDAAINEGDPTPNMDTFTVSILDGNPKCYRYDYPYAIGKDLMPKSKIVCE